MERGSHVNARRERRRAFRYLCEIPGRPKLAHSAYSELHTWPVQTAQASRGLFQQECSKVYQRGASLGRQRLGWGLLWGQRRARTLASLQRAVFRVSLSLCFLSFSIRQVRRKCWGRDRVLQPELQPACLGAAVRNLRCHLGSINWLSLFVPPH